MGGIKSRIWDFSLRLQKCPILRGLNQRISCGNISQNRNQTSHDALQLELNTFKSEEFFQEHENSANLTSATEFTGIQISIKFFIQWNEMKGVQGHDSVP